MGRERIRWEAAVHRLGVLALAGMLGVAGCGGGRPLPPWLDSAPLRYRAASPPPFPRPERLDEGGGGSVGGSELGRFLAFIREKQAELRQPGVAEAERHAGMAALLQMLAWLHDRTEEQLEGQEPLDVYLEFKVPLALKRRQEERRERQVEAKLEEYWRWAQARGQWQRAQHFRRVGRGYLVTENPLYEQAHDALTTAVLAWAYSHTQDPDFARRSPQEVAVYLLAKRGALVTALKLGHASSPHLDFTPEHRDEVPPEELLVELAVGVAPLLGEAADVVGLALGYSVLGHELKPQERLLCAVGVLLPVVSGRALGNADELEHLALSMGRGLQEVQVLQRVAQHLAPAEVSEVQRILRAAGRGAPVTEADVELLRRLTQRLQEPLAEAARALKAGERVALVGSRVTVEGSRLVPGSAEHLAQAWVDYQFRHPGRYPRFSYTPDAEWERMYRTVLKNKEVGGEWEQQVLKKAGYEKNSAMMLPPPGSKEQGFVPDSVREGAEELVWGQPYRFVEVKGRKEMALTGNLKAMLQYVDEHGGRIEVWFRSAKHPDGQTHITQPLRQRLEELEVRGRVRLRLFPE